MSVFHVPCRGNSHMSRDETVNSSHSSGVELHHEHPSQSIDDKRIIDINLSDTHLHSTRNDESRMKSVTDTTSYGVNQSANEESLDLETVKRGQCINKSQVYTSSVLKTDFSAAEKNTRLPRRKGDVTPLTASLLSTAMAATSLTTVTAPAMIAADGSHDASRFVTNTAAASSVLTSH